MGFLVSMRFKTANFFPNLEADFILEAGHSEILKV